jgi:1-phosphatidylinositol-4-phosphate 5-kinase
MLSLTSEYVLVEMSTNSKSGSFFFYSADYRFVLKTCTKREAAFLMAALPPYHQVTAVRLKPKTLL